MIRWLLGTDTTPQTVTIRPDHLKAMQWTEEQQSLNNTGIVSRRIISAAEAARADFWRRNTPSARVLPMKRRAK